MTFNFLSILPLAALTLGGCTLNAKLLGEADFDSATDSDGSTEDSSDATSSSSSASGPEQTSSSSSATWPEATSSSSSAGSDTDQTGTSSTSTTGPEATSSSSSAGSDTDQTSTSSTSTTGPEATSSSSSAGSDTDQTGTSSTSGVETGGQVCEEAPLQAPGVDRSCEVDEDCIVVFHQTDCCGTVDAYGINTQSQAAYAEAEAPCMFEPICDCVPEATDAEDGEATADNDTIVAVCVDNQCRSAIP